MFTTISTLTVVSHESPKVFFFPIVVGRLPVAVINCVMAELRRHREVAPAGQGSPDVGILDTHTVEYIVDDGRRRQHFPFSRQLQ